MTRFVLVPRSTRPGALPSLDGVRGLAMLFVLAGHLSAFQDLGLFTGVAVVGVWLFFVLSSFLLCHYFLEQPARARRPAGWAPYAGRRALRIFPMYGVALCLFFLTAYLQDGNPIWLSVIWRHLSLREAWGHFWTIPVELAYYLVLPFVVLFVLFVLRQNLALLFAAFAAFVLVHQHFVPESEVELVTRHDLLPFLPVFLSGTVAATVHVALGRHRLSRPLRYGFDAAALLILGGVLLTDPPLWSVLVYDVDMDYFSHLFVLYGLAWAAFLVLMLNGAGLVRRLFETSALRFAGLVSFGAYLMHMKMIDVVNEYLLDPSPLAALVIALLTFLCAYVLHVLVERPCSRVNLSPDWLAALAAQGQARLRGRPRAARPVLEARPASQSEREPARPAL